MSEPLGSHGRDWTLRIPAREEEEVPGSLHGATRRGINMHSTVITGVHCVPSQQSFSFKNTYHRGNAKVLFK